MDLRLLLTSAIIAFLALVKDVSASSDTVTVLIYQLSESEWTNQESNFKDAITNAANNFCDEDESQCLLTSGYTDFLASAVTVDSAEYTKPYLTVVFSLAYTDSSQVTGALTDVPSSTLEDIIVASDFDDFNYYIVQVNEVDLSMPPNDTLNIALSVVGLVILVICLTTCLILNWKCGSDPEPVSTEEETADLKSGKPQPIELTSVETVKTIPPREENANGAKFDSTVDT